MSDTAKHNNELDTSAGNFWQSKAFGILMAMTFVSIWTSWILSTRYAVQNNHMNPMSIAVVRSFAAALCFSPWYWRAGLIPKGLDKRLLFFMVFGAGLPFIFSVTSGMSFAPAADIGALLPGTLPLFTAVLGWFVARETYGVWRLVGFVLIAIGILLIAGTAVISGADGAWKGHLLFMTGAFCWAIFTHALRKSGINPLQAGGLVACWSLILVMPFFIAEGGAGLFDLSWQQLLLQFMVQGILSGVIALAAYGLAVTRLGATPTSVFGALVPALVALIAIPMLGEVPDLQTVLAVGGICIGVVLASGQKFRFSRKNTQ